MTTALSGETVGLIGYDEAGRTFAATSHRVGAAVVVVNRSPADLRDQLADEPYAVAESPSELVRRSDLVVFVV